MCVYIYTYTVELFLRGKKKRRLRSKMDIPVSAEEFRLENFSTDRVSQMETMAEDFISKKHHMALSLLARVIILTFGMRVRRKKIKKTNHRSYYIAVDAFSVCSRKKKNSPYKSRLNGFLTVSSWRPPKRFYLRTRRSSWRTRQDV